MLNVSVVTLSINHNITFLGNIKQGLERTISWNKYRPEIATQPNKQVRLFVDPAFRNINRFFVLSLKYGNNGPDDIFF